MISDNDLIECAQGAARRLSYSDDREGPAKHLLHELSRRLGSRTVTIKLKRDGYIMTTLYGSARYLTWREAILWQLFRIAPAGKEVVMVGQTFEQARRVTPVQKVDKRPS